MAKRNEILMIVSIDKMLCMRLGKKVVVWEGELKEIKSIHTEWSLNKKHLDFKLANLKETKEVRDWIKKDDDPEPELDEISANVMPDGHYQDAASWFLEQEKYLSWCSGFMDHADTAAYTKRVLWLSGTPGTGKTTIMFHAHSALARNTPWSTQNGVVRLLPYFCYAKAASQRPNYETILRGLLWHLSLLPNGRLAPKAREEYNLAPSRKSGQIHISSWEKLFLSVLDSYSERDQLVFVIDALDECTDSSEADKFLRFMANKVLIRSNVHLLCASQMHITVDRYFPADRLSNIEMTLAATRHDMEKFVDGEISRRKQASQGNVFCK